MVFRRSYKLLSDNIKGVRVCNIIIANGLELNATSVVGQSPTLKRRNTQVSILRRNGARTSHWRLEVGGREKNNKD